MFKQVVRAARFDRTVYTELFFDRTATANAVLVVGAISALVALSLRPVVIFSSIISGLFGWVILAFALFLIGTKVFGGRGDIQRVMASSGFAHGPNLARIPLVLGAALLGMTRGGSLAIGLNLLDIAVWLWFVAALVVAMEETLGLDRRNSIATCLMSVAVWIGIRLLFRF